MSDVPAAGGKGPRARIRGRTASRVAAVQALFQSEQAGESAETVIDQFVRHRLGSFPGEGGFEEGRVPAAEVTLFGRIVRGAVGRQEAVDRAIVETLPPTWPMARLDPVLRALLRAAVGELADPEGPPAKVVIVAYLDVASGFFEGEERGMVNAILDRVARRMRPDELQSGSLRGGTASP